jgi:hypothetical protein
VTYGAADFRRPVCLPQRNGALTLWCIAKTTYRYAAKHIVLVSGMPTLSSDQKRSARLPPEMRIKMSKTAALGFAPSVTLFGRLMATIDRVLMAHARITIRNGDLPYFGL